jgi:hypothetical protein
MKVVKDTREAELQTANDFLNQGAPFVTITADGRVYTAEEFALSIINDLVFPWGHTKHLDSLKQVNDPRV